MSQSGVPPIGDRIRAERLRSGRSVRGLARDAGVSASLISQIETGKIRPSVSTLYAVTSSLGISVGDLLDDPAEIGAARPPGSRAVDPDPGLDSAAGGSHPRRSALPPEPADSAGTPGLAAVLAARVIAERGLSPVSSGRQVIGPDRDRSVGPVVDPRHREYISLDSGVTWDLLGQVPGVRADFLRITYQPGGASSNAGELMRHSGTEFGYLISGALTLRLGFDEHHLTAGDSVCFPSSTPHSYRNAGPAPAVGIWLVTDQG